jgi:hypothetical protein
LRAGRGDGSTEVHGRPPPDVARIDFPEMLKRSGRGSTLAGVGRGTLALAGAARGLWLCWCLTLGMIWTPGGRPRGVCCVVLNRRPSRRPDASRPCRPPGQARFILPGDLRRPKRPTPVPRSLICRISVFGPVCGTARPKLATPGSPSGLCARGLGRRCARAEMRRAHSAGDREFQRRVRCELQ